VRAEGKKSGKNQSTVSYDITTLEYHESAGGEKTKHEDDMGN
jgi:hypothetical protein